MLGKFGLESDPIKLNPCYQFSMGSVAGLSLGDPSVGFYDSYEKSKAWAHIILNPYLVAHS